MFQVTFGLTFLLCIPRVSGGTDQTNNVNATSVITATDSTSTYISISTTNSNITYPSERPRLENANYELDFTMRLERDFTEISHNVSVRLELQNNITNALKVSVFKNISVTFQFTFRKGSIIADYVAILESVKHISLNNTLDQIKDNSETFESKLNESLPGLDIASFRENIEITTGIPCGPLNCAKLLCKTSIHEAALSSLNPCELIKQACSPSFTFTCSEGGISEGRCVHICIEDTFCGEHGECFYDFTQHSKACRCKEASLTVYHGDTCEESTATLTFFLVMSFAIGGVLIIIFIVTVCLRRQLKKGHQHNNGSANDGSAELEHNNNFRMRVLCLKEVDINGQLLGKHKRLPEPNDQLFRQSRGGQISTIYLPDIDKGPESSQDVYMSAYATIDTPDDTYDSLFRQSRGSQISKLYLPDKDERPVSSHDVYMSTYATIATPADHSIKRQHISVKPNQLHVNKVSLGVSHNRTKITRKSIRTYTPPFESQHRPRTFVNSEQFILNSH